MKYLEWQNPPEKLTLLKNEIHVWRANLDFPADIVENLVSILSEDEKNRANRFRFDKHRDRFIAGRAILRILLGDYLRVKSHFVTFAYSSRGKPGLTTSLNQDSLQFNISHSQNLALYAFNYQRLIGIDLEYIKEEIEYQQLAKRFFSIQELQLINSYQIRDQKQVFFQLWTAKEAYLKATGEGLAGSLDQIEFTLDNYNQLNLLKINQNQKQASYWLINNFIPQDNFVATVAVENTSIISASISTKFFEYQLTNFSSSMFHIP